MPQQVNDFISVHLLLNDTQEWLEQGFPYLIKSKETLLIRLNAVGLLTLFSKQFCKTLIAVKIGQTD